MEVDIGLDNLEPITLNLGDDFGSSRGGSSSLNPGIELLMNDKKRTKSGGVNIDLGDIDRLDSDLNRYSSSRSINVEPPAPPSGGGLLSGFTDFFGGINKSSSTAPSNVDQKTDSGLGYATTNAMGNAKTWDGFSKMNEMPSYNASSGLSDREKRRKKRLMLKKLEEWNEKGHLRSANRFTMDSSYEEIEDEYETALEDKRKRDSIKLQGWWFMTFVNSIEYANAAFNPFDLNLDGWGEQVSEDIDSYEEIFSELYEKYKGGKMAPELSLLMRLGFSACMLNFTNKALSSATPGFNDVIKQSPELMKMFTNATVQSMSQQNPGVAFMSNMMNKPEQVNTSFGPPPKPVETSVHGQAAPVNRPDISMARGTVFKQEGLDVNTGYADLGTQERSTSRPAAQRAEMRGPQTDLDSILSGLKTKTVNIHENNMNTNDNDSKISISSLGNLGNASVPKSSNKRRPRADKNVISVDI
jgi:hypothetical protein